MPELERKHVSIPHNNEEPLFMRESVKTIQHEKEILARTTTTNKHNQSGKAEHTGPHWNPRWTIQICASFFNYTDTLHRMILQEPASAQLSSRWLQN